MWTLIFFFLLCIFTNKKKNRKGWCITFFISLKMLSARLSWLFNDHMQWVMCSVVAVYIYIYFVMYHYRLFFLIFFFLLITISPIILQFCNFHLFWVIVFYGERRRVLGELQAVSQFAILNFLVQGLKQLISLSSLMSLFKVTAWTS